MHLPAPSPACSPPAGAGLPFPGEGLPDPPPTDRVPCSPRPAVGLPGPCADLSTGLAPLQSMSFLELLGVGQPAEHGGLRAAGSRPAHSRLAEHSAVGVLLLLPARCEFLLVTQQPAVFGVFLLLVTGNQGSGRRGKLCEKGCSCSGKRLSPACSWQCRAAHRE